MYKKCYNLTTDNKSSFNNRYIFLKWIRKRLKWKKKEESIEHVFILSWSLRNGKIKKEGDRGKTTRLTWVTKKKKKYFEKKKC